jgi:phosphoribulokinase
MMAEVDSGRRPILVGIGGDSGTGKTTLATAFFALFGEKRITAICHDDYHSLDRRQRALVGLTALNPRANNFALMEEQVWALKRGEPILKPVYDHSDGTLREPERVEPREVVIVQGLHPFLVPGVRHAFDLKVWLDPEPELRLQWKVQRDTAKRGYTRQQVLAELEARRADAEEYIQPQRQHADMIVRFFRPASSRDRDMGHLNVAITQRHSLPRLAFDHGLNRADTVRLALDVVDEDGLRADVIEIDGRITPEEAQLVESTIWAHVDGRHGHLHHVPPVRLGAYEAAARRRHHSDPLALTQLVLAHRILSAQKSYLLRVSEHTHAKLASDHRHM